EGLKKNCVERCADSAMLFLDSMSSRDAGCSVSSFWPQEFRLTRIRACPRVPRQSGAGHLQLAPCFLARASDTVLFMERPALMVIDMLNDFLAEWEPARKEKLIQSINELVEMI